MPDTGAPWNIPYVDPTDLVRDYPQASEDLADAIAAGLSAAGNAGIGSNVVSTAKLDTFTTTSLTFGDITGLTATITPTTATSKVLIIAQVSAQMTQGINFGWGHLRLSGGNATTYVGDTAGSRTSAIVGGYNNADVRALTAHALVFLDSPATGAAVTYSVQGRAASSGGSLHINRGSADDNNADTTRGASSITVIEVAA